MEQKAPVFVKIEDYKDITEIMTLVKRYGMQKGGVIETSEFRDIVERAMQPKID